MTSDAGLDACLLIRTDDVVPATERLALPRASVKIQATFGFFRELRVAREDPVLVSPGFDCVRVEDSPDSAGTDRSAQVPRSSIRQVSGRQSAQRQLGLTDGLTGDRLDDRPIARRKRRACVRGPLDRPRRIHRAPNDDARDALSSGATRPLFRPPYSISLGTHEVGGPAWPSDAGRDEPIFDGRCVDIDQGSLTGT
jgi:hypothetical protein